ncbi:MAG: mechanosensitive ion channel family protein [Candidatus Humimicrobiaceae bacterium]
MLDGLGKTGFNMQKIIENFKQSWLLIVIILAAIIILFVIVRLASVKFKKIVNKKISEEKIEIKKKTYTLISVLSSLVLVLGVLISFLVVADILGINIVPFLTGAGILGVIIGFGAQNLIKDIINGLFILMEQWFQVDDIITVGNISGVVEKFNLRTTVIRDLNGKVHFIPNGQITILGNFTSGWARAVIDVSVSYKENTERVISALEEVFDDLMKKKEYKKFILERPCILGDGGINELGDSSVIFKIAFKVKPPNQWTIERQLRKMIKSKFDEAGIEIPYPCRNIYIKNENK